MMLKERASEGPAISLSHRHVFGLKPRGMKPSSLVASFCGVGWSLHSPDWPSIRSDVKNNVHYAEETQVIYPAGTNAVSYDAANKQQKIFQGAREVCKGL